jgi:hypothetical protein
MKINIFLHETPCCTVDIQDVSEERNASIFSIEEYFKRAKKQTVSHPRRQYSSHCTSIANISYNDV